MTYAEKLKDPRWQKKSGIYKIEINGGLYVGSAVNLAQRLRLHINALVRGDHRNIHLQRAFNKYGNPSFDILEIVDNKEHLIQAEQKFIDALDPKYNIARTAGSQFGFRHSEKTKKRISEIQKGKKLSPETIAAMSSARTGSVYSEGHRKNIAIAKMGEKNPFYKAGENHPQYGRPKSETTRARISATAKANGHHAGHKNTSAKSGVLYDVITGANHIFFSLSTICIKFNLNYNGVHNALQKEKFYKDRWYASFVNIPKEGRII